MHIQCCVTVPQGSILGQVKLNVFVNNTDGAVEWIINKYVDNTKPGGAVDSLEESLAKGFLQEKKALQRDLDSTGQ